MTKEIEQKVKLELENEKVKRGITGATEYLRATEDKETKAPSSLT